MKKIIFLIFLLFPMKSFAGCTDEIDFSWEYGMGNEAAFFKFKSKSSRDIQISELGIWSKNDKLMRTYANEEFGFDGIFYLNAYEVQQPMLNVRGLNLDMSKSAGYKCEYIAKKENITKKEIINKKTNAPKKEQSGTSGSSKSLLKKLLGKD